MLTENKRNISVSITPRPETPADQIFRAEDLEILKQIVDDVSDIENTRSDNEINELLVRKDRFEYNAKYGSQNYKNHIKYESIVCLDDTSRLTIESEKRKERIKKTIDEVRNYFSNACVCFWAHPILYHPFGVIVRMTEKLAVKYLQYWHWFFRSPESGVKAMPYRFF